MEKPVALERVVPYPIEKVFALWLRPETFAEWFLPDPNVRLGKVSVDPRVGGQFLIEMIVGAQTLPHTGTYQKIVPNQAIEFTWHSGMTGDRDTLVKVSFEAQGKGTLMRLLHEGLATDESRKAHGQGWAQIMAAVEPFLSREIK
jgi:uncharacterized protein YndB with AHSA1/START domain